MDTVDDFGFPLRDLPRRSLSELIGRDALGYARLAPGHPARGPSRRLWGPLPVPGAQGRQDPPPVDLIAIPQVEVRSNFMAYAEGEPICGLRIYRPYVSEHFRSGRIERYDSPDTTNITEYHQPAFIISNFNIYTYGHFLLEVMPKAFVIQELWAAGYRYPIVWPQSMAKFAPVFKAIQPNIELLYYDDKATRLHIPLGLFPTVMTSGHYDFHEIFITGARALARSTGIEYSPRRIFITRQNRRSFRQLENERELAEIAVAHGFKLVQPENLPWLEQVRLFAQASHVIGEFSSALHNTMFCPASANVMAFNKMSNAQTAIADSMGHGIGYIMPRGDVVPKFIPDWQEPQRFIIDELEFRERLAQVLASEVSRQEPSSGGAAAGPVDVRALVPSGYAEPDRIWVPSIFTFSIANQDKPRVLVVSGWRGPTPFAVTVSANNDLVASRTFEEGLFEMSVDLPAQSGPVTTVSIATTPSIGPDQRDQRVRGFVVRSLEVRPKSAPSP